jgi:hypothetical protein
MGNWEGLIKTMKLTHQYCCLVYTMSDASDMFLQLAAFECALKAMMRLLSVSLLVLDPCNDGSYSRCPGTRT